MKINLQNYEEYFVRYLDGELSSSEVGEVEFFLQQHPELNAELNAFKSTVLSADDEVFFPKKELLMKGITLANYEDYFIRNVENTLSQEEKIELTEFIQQHSGLQREMNAFDSTKLVADSSIVFPDKNLLKRRDGRIVPMYVRYVLAAAIAASVMLVLMMKGVHWREQPVVPVAQQPASSSASQTNNETKKTVNEISKPPVSNQTELVSQQALNSAKKIVADRSSQGKNANPEKENPQQFADASLHNNPNSSMINAQSNVADEIATISSEIQPISYQARFKKATYRPAPIMTDKNSAASENKSPAKFTSVATALGSELLRLSGREEYLKTTTSAFSRQTNERKKLPLVISIKGKKFDFYHKFFSKRNHSSSAPKPR